MDAGGAAASIIGACACVQDSVQRQDLLFGSHPQEIMTRLGMLRLIQRKVSCDPLHSCLSALQVSGRIEK